MLVDLRGGEEKSASNSIEGYATNCKLHIGAEGRWIVSGRVAGEFPLVKEGNDLKLASGVPPRLLLFNKGHKVTVSMSAGAVTTLHGKRVRAKTDTTFLLADGDDSQFEDRIRKGVLKVVP